MNLEKSIDSKIRVLGQDIPVFFDKNLNHGEDLGHFCPVSNSISLNKTAPHDVQMSTLLHEIIEVIVFKMEIKIEHRDISTLENVLFQVLRENQGFAKLFRV